MVGSGLCCLACGSTRHPAEDGAGNQSSAARVVEVEETAHHLPGRIEARNGMEVEIEHLPGFLVYAQSAKSEGNAAGSRVGIERRRIERLRPVGLLRSDADGRFAVLDRMIELDVLLHRSIEFPDGLQKLIGVDTFELRSELFQSIRSHFCDEFDAVLRAQQILDLGIENLPRELPGLLQNLAAVLGVGKRVKIPALVHEALAIGIDEEPEDVAVLLELVP